MLGRFHHTRQELQRVRAQGVVLERVQWYLTMMSKKDEALAVIDVAGIRAGQVWMHTKTKHCYTVLATGLAEATLTPMVVYGGADGVVWIRDLDVFLGDNGQGTPRFTLCRSEGTDQGHRPAVGGHL